MTSFLIGDESLSSLQNKIAIVTGCSSGIGLATTQLLIEHGAIVVGGDVNPSPIEGSNFTFVKTDVTSWSDLTNLFKTAKQKHSRIDHVFANAGVIGRADYVKGQVDDKGDLVEPTTVCYDINLRGCINTATLAIHYFQQQDHPSDITSSVVLTASCASFQRFRLVDYTTTKHAVLGFMRGLAPILHPTLPIRINAVAPSWTTTALVPEGIVERIVGIGTQKPPAAARSVAILMADASRHGQLIHSCEGKYLEVEEAVLLPAAASFIGHPDEDEVMAKLMASGELG